MTDAKSASAPSGLLLSLFLTGAVVGCNPAKHQEDPRTAQISPLSEQAATCEAQLRRKMLEKGFKLRPVPGLEKDVEAANDSVIQTNQILYSFIKTTQIVAVKLEHAEANATTYRGIRYDLSKAANTSESPMILSVEIENIQPNSDLILSQQYNVSEACELALSATYRTHLRKTADARPIYEKTSVYSDGQKQSEKDQFLLPAGANLVNFVPFADDPNRLPPRPFGYIAKVGVVALNLKEGETQRRPEFGLDLVLKIQNLNLNLEGRSLVSILYGEDKAQKITLTEIAGRATWRVPKNLWESQSLGSSGDLNAQARSEIPKKYFYTHNSMELLTNRMPSYDHFSAYWTISRNEVDSPTQQLLLTLNENKEAIIFDKVSVADLISNDTIQTEIPQVQAIAKEIYLQQPKNRRRQIQRILEYLGTNYIYDYEMLKNNSIRPLTTEEAFARGKGVCQHYAVLFTAIARALKIPSRIVVGYLLTDGNAGLHAWVEAEVFPGIWRVIEPQSANGLNDTFARFYFPTARATFLEDKNASMTDYMAELLSLRLTFRPVR